MLTKNCKYTDRIANKELWKKECLEARVRVNKEKKMELAQNSLRTMTTRKHYSGRQEVSQEYSKEIWSGEGNVDSGFQVQPEEDGGGSTKDSRT